MIVVTAAVEGIVDEVLLKRVCNHAGAGIGLVYGRTGKSYILSRLAGYNNSARFRHWVVLLGLDNDASCAPEVLPKWLRIPSALMRLRVAVRELEAWIIADVERLVDFLGVAIRKVPSNPDSLPDPKLALVNLARDSKRRAVREDMVPRPGSGQSVGPANATRMVEFLQDSHSGWRPGVASGNSDSLRKCITAVSELTNVAFPGP
jgi:hypothetical protein